MKPFQRSVCIEHDKLAIVDIQQDSITPYRENDRSFTMMVSSKGRMTQLRGACAAD